MRRFLTLLVLVGLAGPLSACSTDAARTKVYITRAGQIVVTSPLHKAGETILRIENDDAAKHRVVLLKLTAGTDPRALPQLSGIVPIGKSGDLEYQGQGYQVVEKLQTMRPFYGGDQRVVTVMHTYLGNGRYVLLSDLAGDYSKGVWTTFAIGAHA